MQIARNICIKQKSQASSVGECTQQRCIERRCFAPPIDSAHDLKR